MKVLVDSPSGQGERPNDFRWTEGGEILEISPGSDVHDGEAVDGRCGCRRAFSGTTSRLATTTGVVADEDITFEALVDRMVGSRIDGGWGDLLGEDLRPFTEADAHEVLGAIATLPVGTVVERRGEVIQERDLP